MGKVFVLTEPSKRSHVCNICKKEYECPSTFPAECRLGKEATCNPCYDKLTDEGKTELII